MQGRTHLPAIAWLSLFGLLAVIIMFSFLVLRDRDDVVDEATRHAQEQALVLADHAARLFEAAELALSTTVDDTQQLDWAGIRRSPALWDRLRRLANRLPYLEAFWLNDHAGRLMLTSQTFPAPALDESGRDYVSVHRDTPDAGVHVSPRIESGGDATFRLSRRIESPDGSFRGVASLTIEAGHFQLLYGSLPLPAGASVKLLRLPDLSPLVQVEVGGGDAHPIGLHDRAHLRDALATAPEGGQFRAVAPTDGRERVYAYKRVPGFPLMVKVSVPLDSLRGKWLALVRSRLLMAGMALAAWAMLTALGFRQHSRARLFQRELAERVAERTAELAQANAQLETLIHEVHHRVNNNLQIIGSLLTLQSARVTDVRVHAALSQSTGRVHTLSLAYQTLYGTGGMVELPFGRYLTLLVRQIGDLYHHDHVAIIVEGGDPLLHIDTAIPLALVVHEVLSNALAHAFPAHAFPDGRGGSVRLALAEDGEDWRLTVADDGIGLPAGLDWERAHSLGFTIIRALVAQLGGRADYAGGTGTTFTLRVAASR